MFYFHPSVKELRTLSQVLITEKAAAKMTKRTASEAFAESPRSRSLSPSSKIYTYGLPSPPYSPRSPMRRASVRLESETAQLNLASESSLEEVVNEADDPLLYRILAGLEYTRAQHAQGRSIMQTTRFAINKREHRYPGLALRVLHRAGRKGHATHLATRFFEGDIHQLWELGIPRPEWVTEGALGGLHNPQWWYGLDAARIKAGPWATEEDVKRVRANLKRAETTRRSRLEKSKRGQAIDWKLEEGLRRQEHGEKMWDIDGADSETSLTASEGSDSSTTDPDESDDEPLMLRLGRWKVAQHSRPTPDTSNVSSRRRSVLSGDSEAYEPSASGTDYSDNDGSRRTGIMSRPHDGDDKRLMLKLRRRKAAQRDRSTILSSSHTSRTELESDDEEPLVPVFSN